MENSAGKRSKSRRSAGIWHFSTTFWSTGTAKPCCQTNKAQGPSLPCHSDNSALHTGQDSVPLGSYQSNIPIRASATQKGAAKRPNACWAAGPSQLLCRKQERKNVMQKSLQVSLAIIALLLGCIVFGVFSRSARSQSPALVTSQSPALVTSQSPALVTSQSPALVTSQSPALVTSQSPLPMAASPSRYQLLFPRGNFEFIVDTQTGRVWYRDEPGSPWIEESPDTTKAPAYTKLPRAAKP